MGTSVEIEQVSKRFKLYKEKPTSAKERVIRVGRMPFEEFWALRDVSFDVATGETVGLLGHNGSGKSTLLKCMSRTLRPTSGSIRIKGRVAALLELGAGFHGELTGRENVYLNGSILGFSTRDIDAVLDDIIEFSELSQFIDMQVRHYSSGMYARLAFAVAVNVDPEVLLIDEVLAVGDEAFQRKCLQRIKRFQTEGRTIFLVTHAADLVRQLCDRAVVLDRGHMVTVGAPGDAVRIFRETLLERGLEIPEEANESTTERPTGAVHFESVRIEYPRGGTFAAPADPVRISIRYDTELPVDDCIFAIHLNDQEGNLLLGTNTQILGVDLGVVDGPGEVVIELPEVHLLDGVYPISLGIHDSVGIEFDHRDQVDHIEVASEGRMVGRVHLPVRVHHTRSAGTVARPDTVVG